MGWHFDPCRNRYDSSYSLYIPHDIKKSLISSCPANRRAIRSTESTSRCVCSAVE